MVVSKEASSHHWTQAIATEIAITARMCVDNAPFSLITVPACALSANAYFDVDLGTAARGILIALFVGALYTYVFDAINQARYAVEDRVNKPYRPIPAGLTTPRGMLIRAVISSAITLIVSWPLDIMPWSLGWVSVSLIIYTAKPSQYFWVKRTLVIAGPLACLGAGWRIVGPFDPTILTGIVALSVALTLTLPFEDIRDMAGDRAMGRRTPPLMLGEWPIRIWFAAWALAMPVAAHFFLFAPTDAAIWRVLLCDVALAALSWTAAIRALTRRGRTADRVTYQIYIASFLVTVASGLILWT